MRLRFLFSVVAATALLGLPMLASADLAPPSLTISGWTPSLAALHCTTDTAGVSTCDDGGGTLTRPGGALTLTEWNVTLDPDPTVVGFLAIQNNLAVAQTFNITFLLPIVPQGPQVQVNGSISGSLTDSTGNGSSLTDFASNPIYRAQIDGVPIQSLLNAPQSYSTTTSTTFGPAAFGPTILNQTANTSIAINVVFTLSPGDLASFTSVFNVVAVPEPATLLLLSGGLAGLVGLGRRYPRA